MREILIFAGTTEGRRLSECLTAAGVAHVVCVATEYGEIVLKEHPLAKVHRGRMNQEEIRQYIGDGEFAAVVDATHPYAVAVTENIKAAMKNFDIPYLRLERENDTENTGENIVSFESNEACARALEKLDGNILLTTGSKELSTYCVSEDVKKRLYVRVLPGMESLGFCMEQGIAGKQILALQGPFSTEMNEAILRQYQIKCLVTKKSGKTGGYREKLEAAQRVGIPVFVIERAGETAGYSFREVCSRLKEICGKKITQVDGFEITLAGVGMGAKESLTREVYQAIEKADILLGAERMVTGYEARLEKKPFYRAEQIIPYLEEMQEKCMLTDGGRVVILFSGDSGFYSGCQMLYHALQEEISADRLNASVRILPGISSVAYLAACIGESYEDAEILSIHGRKQLNLVNKIKSERKIFLLMSGVEDLNRLGRLLLGAGLELCTVFAGYQLSYPEQQIKVLTPKECTEQKEEGLYICCIKNPVAECRILTHGIADGEFIREKVPMTKEEVREVSICKLRLHKEAVVYDIGSGTGSIAVEMAGMSENIQVYAIEHKEEAAALIERNREKFGLENIKVILAEAPEGLQGLPVPTHAFIGGSGGRMKEILSTLYQMNPRIRMVINAISMETICEIKEVLDLYPVEKEEVIQMQVSRSRKVGAYHLMQAENPVWICAFNFCER